MALPNCSKCGALKTGSYLKGSQCGKCIEVKRKERRIRRRKELGLPGFGEGRDPKCKICRKIKEKPYINGSWCRECKLKRAKIDYHKKSRAKGISVQKKGRNPLCSKCDAVKERKQDQYCCACRAKMKRERYALKKSDPNFMMLERQKAIKKFQENEDARLKKNCREATHRAIKTGKILKQKCEICGEEEVQSHHDDYTDPFNVRWLCIKHHTQHHFN